MCPHPTFSRSSPNTTLSTKSSQMSYWKTISLLISLKSSLISTYSEGYLCLARQWAPDSTDHIVLQNNVHQTLDLSYLQNYQSLCPSYPLASTGPRCWRTFVWVYDSKNHRTLLVKRPVCIFVSLCTHNTHTAHIYQVHKLVAWKLDHFNMIRTHK